MDEHVDGCCSYDQADQSRHGVVFDDTHECGPFGLDVVIWDAAESSWDGLRDHKERSDCPEGMLTLERADGT